MSKNWGLAEKNVTFPYVLDYQLLQGWIKVFPVAMVDLHRTQLMAKKIDSKPLGSALYTIK